MAMAAGRSDLKGRLDKCMESKVYPWLSQHSKIELPCSEVVSLIISYLIIKQWGKAAVGFAETSDFPESFETSLAPPMYLLLIFITSHTHYKMCLMELQGYWYFLVA